MGALHEGHLALVRQAKAECDVVAASVYVNPLQFNDKKDLEHYPRHPQEDAQMLAEAGCDMLLMPGGNELLQHLPTLKFELGALGDVLEGAHRPGHFMGVVQVVERLFHFVRPDVAYFGEKDRQQLAVVRSAAKQLHWPLQIIGCPTVRAADGLALSSRNARLNERERQEAPVLYRALQAISEAAFKLSVEDALAAGNAVLAQVEAVKPDYLTIAHPETLQPLKHWNGLDEAVALVAARLGPVRLIDNITLTK
jgi:pantoate--beta-alanine ligase